MCVKKESKTGIYEVPNLHGQVEAATSTDSTIVDCCCDESGSQSAQFRFIGDYSNILSAIEQLIGEGIRNFFNDPQNHHMFAACLVLNDQKKPANSNMSRNISNNEILRPRDLPQVTGLGKTSIWRLEKAGLFVRKLKLSSGCVGYLRIDVESWLASKQESKGGK